MQTFSGAWPALVTPFTQDNEMDTSGIEKIIQHLLDLHVDGFYLCGSTGQGVYQTVQERKLVAETALRCIDGQVPAIVHVGSQALPEAIELAVHAQSIGASGISSIIPAGYERLESITRYYTQLAASVPDLPFLPYLFTSSSSAIDLITAIDDIPNLAGAKYTGPNMYELRQVIEARQQPWSVFSGMDEQCVFGAMLDTCGNIGSTLNVMPGIYRKIHQLVGEGDAMAARDLQLRANKITSIMFRYDIMSAMFVAINFLGVDIHGPRLPSMPFDRDRMNAYRKELENNDFFEIAAM